MSASETINNEANRQDLSDTAIKDQMEHIFASPGFVGSVRLQELLTYVVNETLEGRANRVKGVTIVQDVFGQTNTEAAQSSTVVSVEAGRLRRKLADYYLTNGTDAPVHISIPKGTFVPVFRRNVGSGDSGSSETLGLGISRQGGRPALIFLTTAALALLIGAASLFSSYNIAPTSVASGGLSNLALAVVPFRNATNSLANEPMVAGLTQDIITDLARSSEIDVISYSSVSLLTNSEMPPLEIADVLNVSHILQGSVRGEIPGIRVNAELLDANTGKVIWTNRFDHDAADPLAMQDKIALRVIEDMAPHLKDWPGGSQVVSPSTGVDTMALFNQAKTLVNPPSNAGRLKIAQLAFETVIDADPEFVGGHAGVAYVRAFNALWGHVSDIMGEATESAKLANEALEIDPSAALALEALAFAKLVLRDFDGAVESSEQALRSAPNDPYVHSYHAFILTANGQPKKAVSFAEQAIRLDPLGPRTPYRNILAVVQLHAENYEQALQALAASRKMGGPRSPGHLAAEASALALLGNTDEAKHIVDTLPRGFIGGPWLAWQKRSFRRPEDAEKFPNLLLELD
jgi:adenylate cyclase